MVVTIAYDASPGVQKWVVNQGSGGLLGGINSQSTHNSQSAATSAARRMAKQGEKIVLKKKRGGQTVIRQGS